MVNFEKNIPLKRFSSFKIGGPAKLFSEVSSVEELKEVLLLSFGELRIAQNKIAILGSGTNILIDDKGFDGLVIHNRMNSIKREGNDVVVGSGVEVASVLSFCISNSLSGLEWAGGLPGTLGAAIRGNAGAFAGEIKDTVFEVKSLDIETLTEKRRANGECLFGYRDSVFKRNGGEVVSSVVLRLTSGKRDQIRQLIQEKIDYRQNKHPMEYPNIGSIFKNIPFSTIPQKWKNDFGAFVKTDPFPIVPTAKLLAIAGLKGRRIGGAMISDKHPNFIVNIDNATSEDVKALMQVAKEAIHQKYGITLEEEIVYLGQ